jgi:phosphoesterase RecJ-like protein
MTPTTLDFAGLEAFIRRHTRFVIITHVNPDGDALGSEIGFAEWLISLGKTVHVINHSPTPHNYLFLDDPDPVVQQFDAKLHDSTFLSANALFLLDVNDPERARSLGPYLSKGTPPVCVIDHHLEPKQFADLYLVDTDATSTGEMIYRIIRELQPRLGGSISPKAAMALYVAIITDTGSFRFPRTDSEVLRMCADLLDAGADPVRAYEQVYNQSPASRLLLMRDCLNSLQYHHHDRVAIQFVLQAQLKEINAQEEDVDGFVQMPFQVRGIVLSIFLLELKEGWKVSVRSKGDVSAASVAQKFGGNGHFHAAGARIHGTLTLREMLDALVQESANALHRATEVES